MKLDPAKLVKHVNDADAFELPFRIEIELPKIFGHQITKFMVLELAAAILMVLIFVPLARKLANGGAAEGAFLEHVRGDRSVHPRRRGSTGGRASRRPSFPAVHTHDVLLHSVLQSDGLGSMPGLADRVLQRDRPVGDW